MTDLRQARWHEPTLFEMSNTTKRGFTLPTIDPEVQSLVGDPLMMIPQKLQRTHVLSLPSLSEVEVVRHFTRLSQMSFGVDSGLYPLGSCTMKYNPKVNEKMANLDQACLLHPAQDETTIQGALELLYKLSQWLSEITGTSTVSLQPAAGAQGELAGVLIMRAHHKQKGELETRDEIIVPDTAHGTNPASAAMAGFKVVVVPTGDDGCVNFEALKSVVSHHTAGLMLTNPNTLGIFEAQIIEMTELVHEVGGLLYYDGANLNAILGKARAGDMGFDIVHINLHKTFSTPHGGGGPGSGPIGVMAELVQFLPIPQVEYDGKRFYLDYNRPQSIGKVMGFYGNFGVLVRAFTYILSMGPNYLVKASEIAVLNANYLAKKLSAIKGFDLPYGLGKSRKHECVISCSQLKQDTGIGAGQVGKRLMDYGIHAPTVYFPSIVDEALMIEPTETETIDELDRLVDIFTQISHEAYTNPKTILGAPYNAGTMLLDEVKASHPRTMCLNWRMSQKAKRIR